jgi:hypothetical protein
MTPPDPPQEHPLTPDGTAAHLDDDQLADLDEGLLQRDAAVAARSHLERCARCRARQGDLSALRADLADLAGLARQPLPDDVAARLDTALAAEAGSDARPSSVTVVPSLPQQQRRDRSRWGSGLVQAAAVLVVLLALGGVGYSLITSGGGNGVSTAGSAASDSAGKAGERGSATGGTPTVVRSGRDYTATTLGSALTAVIARRPAAAANGDSPPSAAGSSPETGSALLSSPAALDACVAGLGYTTPALGVDLATFQGKPAAVVVVPTEDDPTHVDVYAVAPSCPPNEFLAFSRVARR